MTAPVLPSHVTRVRGGRVVADPAMARSLHSRRDCSRSGCTQRGFTLIELGAVLALLVLLVGIAVPTLNSLTGATARSSLGKLASNIRATRGAAALEGKTCRLSFDIDESSYSVECAEGLVRHGGMERSRGGARDTRDDPDFEKDESRLTEAERFQRQILRRTSFAPTPKVPSQRLEGGLEIVSVWTSHQEEKYTKGTAHLYFYPSGLGEHADIRLRHGDDEFTVHVFPLAGRVKVHSGSVELKGVSRNL